MNDRVKVRKLRALGKLQRVTDDVLERRAPAIRGGWSCDATAGGCGRLLVIDAPPLRVQCSGCGRRWQLAGGMTEDGFDQLLVWYVPERLS